jgi:hypothetical protein
MQGTLGVFIVLMIEPREMIHKVFHKGEVVFPMFADVVLIMSPNGRNLGQIGQ